MGIIIVQRNNVVALIDLAVAAFFLPYDAAHLDLLTYLPVAWTTSVILCGYCFCQPVGVLCKTSDICIPFSYFTELCHWRCSDPQAS